MARIGITYEQVSAAIDQLIAEGANPTIMGIREVLGTGSPNTIHRHLTTWKQAAPVVVRRPVDLPGELKGALVAEIERQAAAARAEVEKALTTAQQEAETLAEAGEVVETENQALLEEVEALRMERERLAALAAERQTELEKLDGELLRERQAAEASRLELAKEQLKTERLAADEVELKVKLKEFEAKATDAAKEAAQAAQAAAVSSARLEAEQANTKDLKARLDAAEKRIGELQKSAEVAKAEHTKAMDKLRADNAKALEKLNTDLRQSLDAKAAAERGKDAAERTSAELVSKIEALEAANNKAVKAKA